MALEGKTDQDWFIQQLERLVSCARIKSESELCRLFRTISIYVHKVQYAAQKKITERLETAKTWPVS
jgi:hypothetical protein